MTDFAVTGKKRSGKGLFCVGLIRDALREGRRVATNMDVFPETMFSPWTKFDLIRLPDVPTVADMEALGKGYSGDKIREEFNGLIVLDECSKFFNSRQWGDKGRQPLLDWLIHSGKLRWDVYYQQQGLEQIDKQLRTTQMEYHISVKRTDKWPIPFATTLGKLFGLKIRFPKMHMGIVKHGMERDSMIVDRKWYKAKELYACYDTEQVFLDRDHPDANGMFTVLPPYYTKGRYLAKPPNKFFVFVFNLVGYDWISRLEKVETFRRKPKHRLVRLLSNLSELEAIQHFKRLDSLGAFDRAVGAA